MSGEHQTRRHFLGTTATAGTVLSLGEWTGLLPLSPASAAEATVTPDLVRFGPNIEPVVRLIEEAPRARCVAVMIEQLQNGLPYRHFLAALYLASIRAAKYHGTIHGYDHSAYVVYSAHQLSLDLPPAIRLLPAFFALECFKGGQQAYPNRPPMLQLSGQLPAAGQATAELHSAMREWEPEQAERAIVAMVRSLGRSAVFEPLWHYAGRDWGFIGHMAIHVENACRLLETIGWQHAEHVLRYVVAALAGWGKAHANHSDVQPYWGNLKRVETALDKLPGDWAGNEPNEGFTRDLLASIRAGGADGGDATCDLAVRGLVGGQAQARAVWDAVHLAAGELVLSSRTHAAHRPINSTALHANTAANALHYAFRASARQDTRLLLTLQALAWMHLSRQGITRAKHLVDAVDITRLSGLKLPERREAAIETILATRTARPQEASRLAFAYAQRHPAGPLLQAARVLLPAKSSGDPHDIKFPVAVFEDLDLVSRAWRPHLMAVAAYSFWGSERPDLPVIQSVREAIRKL